MSITKLQAESLNLADDFTFTGTVAGAGGNNRPAFQATMSADQTLSDNTLTKIQFNQETFDTDGCYDPTTNYRFTPTTAGKYFFITTLNHLNNYNAGRSVVLYIYKNGSPAYAQYHYNNDDYGSANFITLTTEAIIDMNGSTDYVEVYATIDVIGGLIIVDAEFGATGAKATVFKGFKIIT